MSLQESFDIIIIISTVNVVHHSVLMSESLNNLEKKSNYSQPQKRKNNVFV